MEINGHDEITGEEIDRDHDSMKDEQAEASQANEFNLSEKIIPQGRVFSDKPKFIDVDDVKEFIRQIMFWAEIHLGKRTLTINFDKFKELAGDKLI